MKRLTFLLALLFTIHCSLFTAHAQTVTGMVPLRWVSALPAKCETTNKAKVLVYKYTATSGVYYCSSTDTWTLVTGSTSIILGPNGTAAAPTFSFTSNTNTGVFRSGANALGFTTGGTERGTLSSTGLLTTTGGISTTTGTFTSAVINGATSGSVTLAVPAVAGANTITLPAGTTNFSATGGTSQVVKQTTAGGALTVAQLATSDLSDGVPTLKSYLAADVVYNNTVTLANTALSVTVAAGGIYDIEFAGYTAFTAKTLKFDLAGGTATATNFRGYWSMVPDTANSQTYLQVSSPSSVLFNISQDGLATQGFYQFKGTIEVNSGGTFIVRAAQGVAAASNSTLERGSTLILRKLN